MLHISSHSLRVITILDKLYDRGNLSLHHHFVLYSSRFHLKNTGYTDISDIITFFSTPDSVLITGIYCIYRRVYKSN